MIEPPHPASLFANGDVFEWWVPGVDGRPERDPEGRTMKLHNLSVPGRWTYSVGVGGFKPSAMLHDIALADLVLLVAAGYWKIVEEA